MAFNSFTRSFKLLIVAYFVSAEHEGRGCILSSGGKGRCIEIERCAPMTQKSPIKTFSIETCQEDRNVTVCCPLFENIVTPSQKCLFYYRNNQQNLWNIFSNEQRLPIFKSFIVAGVQTLAKEFPHMAALGFGDENEIQWRCGGSLIHEQFVLTAAHCVSSTEIGEVQRVRLGDLNLRSTADDQHLQEFTVAQIFRHPKYVPPVLYNDIALVQLDRPVQITDYVKPVCLQTGVHIQPNINLIATGWGRVQFGGYTSDELMKVTLNFFRNTLCRQAYSSVANRQLPYGIVEETQICAGDMNGQKDTCQGDSGGPLQIVDSHNHNLYHIIGVTSFGKGCGTSTNPGVYTKVSYYIPWIEEIIWPN